MTELHSGLELYRDQLREAVARDLVSKRSAGSRSRRTATRVALPAGAAAVAVALAVALTGGSPVASADAAILHHVARALAPPPGMILHERAVVTASWGTAPYELWESTSSPYAYRVNKWGHSGSGMDSTPYDPAAALRSLVQSGQATLAGTTTIDGVAAYKLDVNGAADQFLNGTAYVSQSDYHPLEIDTSGGGGERIVFQTYQYLRATSANMQLVHAGRRTAG